VGEGITPAEVHPSSDTFVDRAPFRFLQHLPQEDEYFFILARANERSIQIQMPYGRIFLFQKIIDFNVLDH
jgi:hypothetical protein